MPRNRPPYLLRERTRHGKSVWYVRIGEGPRTRIRGEYGTPEFMDAYQAAVTGMPTGSRPGKVPKGSLAWLAAQYRESSAWLNALSQATKRQRENIFEHVLASAGAETATSITRKDIVADSSDAPRRPRQNFLETMHALFEWAKEAEHIKVDPTVGVKPPPRPKTQGFPVWTEGDVARYEVRRFRVGGSAHDRPNYGTSAWLQPSQAAALWPLSKR
jgi:heat shock protein HspQ